MASDTVAGRHSDMRAELERFNSERCGLLGGIPPNPEMDRMPLERSGVGGDVEEGDA